MIHILLDSLFILLGLYIIWSTSKKTTTSNTKLKAYAFALVCILFGTLLLLDELQIIHFAHILKD